MNRVFNKIKQARELIGLSQQQFADESGVSQRDVSQLENGKKEFIPNSVIHLLNKHSIDTNSLFNDDVEVSFLLKEKNIVPESPVKESKQHKTGLPLIPIDALAGMSSGDTTILKLDCEYYSVPDFNKKADYLIRISGNSMSPKYYNGDIVACKRVPKDTFIQWGKVYVMDTIQGALCKRLEKSIEKEHILIVSDNPKYKPFEMDKKEIRSLAIVIGVIRLE